MKHIHMLMAVIIIVLFINQSYHALGTPSSNPTNKGVKIATHITYLLVILTGGWMLVQLMSVNAPVQWVFAKMILLIAAISASVKAFSATANPTQRKVGIAIATVAYVGIVTLAIVKPGNLF